MKIDELRIQGLRCLGEVVMELDGGINVFSGANGAGKTSILEAVFLLSHARSFRSGAREALLQRGAEELSVYAVLKREQAAATRVGLGRKGPRWLARVDSETVPIGQLVRECAVVCFEPGSHALIAGSAEERRRYLDWGVFHVEHEFLLAWRRYQRALKQRNSLLRAREPVSDQLFLPWEQELSVNAHLIDRHRTRYLEMLKPHLLSSLGALLPELGSCEIRYRRGWSEEHELVEPLAELRGRDLSRGHTTLGAHRADWSIAFEAAPLREHLSRGQEKLTALGCMLAQAELFALQRGEWPIVCLDDLASELDQQHQAAVVAQLAAGGAQVLLTGTEVPPALTAAVSRVFHVEQGRLKRLL